ncbi:MAG TPA: hypothetical protein VIA06_17205 [Candidatus Dormibacteraeota bacterium]|jgi:hypothetical protein|nr:hypothetical protein [Candidatus Dormibacteraeota bacterium]
MSWRLRVVPPLLALLLLTACQVQVPGTSWVLGAPPPLLSRAQAVRIVTGAWSDVRHDAHAGKVDRVTAAFTGPALRILESQIEKEDPDDAAVGSGLLTQALRVKETYVPRQHGYPAAFLAVGRFQRNNGAYALFLFTRASARVRWRGEAIFYRNYQDQMPPIGGGDGTYLPAGQSTLAAAPHQLPSRYAGYLTQGVRSGHAGGAFAVGALTTGTIGQLRSWADTEGVDQVSLNERFSGSAPVATIPLPGGGALVIFPMTWVEYAVAAKTSCVVFDRPGGLLPSGAYADVALIDSGDVAAVDPAHGRVSVVERSQDLVAVTSTVCNGPPPPPAPARKKPLDS